MFIEKRLQIDFPGLPFGFLFLRKNERFDDGAGKLAKSDDAATDFKRIRCPLCAWKPQKSSRWFCADLPFPEFFFDGCGTFWNTFETGGRCPGCAHQWRWTTCLRCYQHSKHADWYEENSDGA